MGGSLDQMTGLHAASDNNDTTADLSPLITLYERVVAEKNRYIKLLVTISCVLVGILVFILLFDITNGAVGFIRYWFAVLQAEKRIEKEEVLLIEKMHQKDFFYLVKKRSK